MYSGIIYQINLDVGIEKNAKTTPAQIKIKDKVFTNFVFLDLKTFTREYGKAPSKDINHKRMLTFRIIMYQ